MNIKELEVVQNFINSDTLISEEFTVLSVDTYDKERGTIPALIRRNKDGLIIDAANMPNAEIHFYCNENLEITNIDRFPATGLGLYAAYGKYVGR